MPNGTFSTALYWFQTDLVKTDGNVLTSDTAPLVPWLSPALELPCNKTDTFVVLLYPQPENFSVPAKFDAYFANIRANPVDFSVRLNSNITDLLSTEALIQEGGDLVRITGACPSAPPPANCTNTTIPSKPSMSPLPFEGASSALLTDSALMMLGLGLGFAGWMLAMF